MVFNPDNNKPPCNKLSIMDSIISSLSVGLISRPKTHRSYWQEPNRLPRQDLREPETPKDPPTLWWEEASSSDTESKSQMEGVVHCWQSCWSCPRNRMRGASWSATSDDVPSHHQHWRWEIWQYATKSPGQTIKRVRSPSPGEEHKMMITRIIIFICSVYQQRIGSVVLQKEINKRLPPHRKQYNII